MGSTVTAVLGSRLKSSGRCGSSARCTCGSLRRWVGGGRLILGVVFDVVAEAGEILVAVGFGESGHLRGDAVHFLEADLVNLGGGEVGGGEAAQRGLVTALAATERVDGERGAGRGM